MLVSHTRAALPDLFRGTKKKSLEAARLGLESPHGLSNRIWGFE